MTDTANAPERIWAWPHGYRVVAPEGSDDITQYRWVPNFDVTDIGEGQAWTAPTPQMPGATKYVLATHCDELVAAAYLDAARVPTSFLVGDPPNGIPFRSPMAHEVAEAIKDRTPDDARAALIARDERMKAEGASEAQAKIARLTEALKEIRDRHINPNNGFAGEHYAEVRRFAGAALQENAKEDV